MDEEETREDVLKDEKDRGIGGSWTIRKDVDAALNIWVPHS